MDGCQSHSLEVVCTAIPQLTEPMRAKDCVQCVHSGQRFLPAWSAVEDIFILFFLFLNDGPIMK